MASRLDNHAQLDYLLNRRSHFQIECNSCRKSKDRNRLKQQIAGLDNSIAKLQQIITAAAAKNFKSHIATRVTFPQEAEAIDNVWNTRHAEDADLYIQTPRMRLLDLMNTQLVGSSVSRLSS